MIESLHGKLVAKRPGSAVLRLGGVGLLVHIPLSTYDALPRPGQEAGLITHLHVRDDDVVLYGFGTELERELFRMLLGVSRIGPAVALRVVSCCPAADFKRYVLDEDADAIRTLVRGIGTKTARRLVAELREAVEDLDVQPTESMADTLTRDAVQALMALGESRITAEKAVRAALEKLGPETDQQALIQEALSG